MKNKGERANDSGNKSKEKKKNVSKGEANTKINGVHYMSLIVQVVYVSEQPRLCISAEHSVADGAANA